MSNFFLIFAIVAMLLSSACSSTKRTSPVDGADSEDLDGNSAILTGDSGAPVDTSTSREDGDVVDASDTLEVEQTEDASATDRSDADIERYVPPPPDEPLSPPNCGGDLSPGDVRVAIGGVLGRVAIDETGTVYAPFASEDGELELRALDPCGDLIWKRVVAAGLPRQEVAARLPGDNEVVLEALWDARQLGEGLWRFDRQGEPLELPPIPGTVFSWVAANEHGVYLKVFDDGQGFLTRLSLDGNGEPLKTESGRLSEEECAVYGNWLGCVSATFDATTLDVAWNTDRLDLIDGTTRHTVNPAIDGDTFFTIVYGISNYRFVAQSLRTGERLWSRNLGPSPSGQYGLVTGGPVIGENGWLYVYIGYAKAPVYGPPEDPFITVVEEAEYFGWLIAFDQDGNEQWRYESPSEFSEYEEHATHVIGRNGFIYLATASGVSAVDAINGEEYWKRASLGIGRIERPRVALSPNGDLLVQLDRIQDSELYFIATNSIGGTADSPWPAPGGDRRNLNGR